MRQYSHHSVLVESGLEVIIVLSQNSTCRSLHTTAFSCVTASSCVFQLPISRTNEHAAERGRCSGLRGGSHETPHQLTTYVQYDLVFAFMETVLKLYVCSLFSHPEERVSGGATAKLTRLPHLSVSVRLPRQCCGWSSRSLED